MSRYNEQYIFRKANIADVDRLMRFIREHWRADHILGNDRDFFLYEHGNGKEVNFVICEDKKTTELVGVHGFIPYSCDPQLRHVCGVMTMVKKDIGVPMLGVELINQFITLMQYQTYCGIGTNSRTMVPLVKRLFHRSVGQMQHYYCLNKEIDDFRIANIISHRKCTVVNSECDEVELIEFKDFEELKSRYLLNQSYRFLPYKEDWYIKRRYFEHPIYCYHTWGLCVNGQVIALLIGREIICNQVKILRFVDYIGDIEALSQIRKEIEKIIKINQYEYADFLLHGVPQYIMNQAGFVLKTEDGNIIPNYFEPFIQSNIEIWFETSHEEMVIFKSDADGDRPSQWLLQ